MSGRPVYIEAFSYLCGRGDDSAPCLERFAESPRSDAPCPTPDQLKHAGVERRLRSQISEHALLSVVAAQRCTAHAGLSPEAIHDLSLFVGVPGGSELGRPFLEALRSALAETPELTRAQAFEARSVNVLDLLRLSTGNSAGHVARTLGLHGENACYIGRQASYFALSRAQRAIAGNAIDRALVVGGESSAMHETEGSPLRAGVALLLSATYRPDSVLLELTSSTPGQKAPFACFESLDALLNLAYLLETLGDASSASVEERGLHHERRCYGIRRASEAHASEPAANRRVVITALGLVTPLGNDLATFSDHLFAGRSAARKLSDALGSEWSDLPVRAVAPVTDLTLRCPADVPLRELERSGRFALEALTQVVNASGAELLRKVRAPLYCGIGASQQLLDFDEIRRLQRGEDSRVRKSAEASELGTQILRAAFGLTGSAQTFAGACSASTQACIQAAEEIRRGQEVCVIAGGHDSLLSVPGLYMMHELGTLANGADDPARAVRPFDSEREGTLVGEGAVYFLFEELEHARARGATILAEVSGWGSSLDGHHITSPDPEGTYGVAMIRRALALAQIAPERVDYVNAHGTATLLNDVTEARIIASALGQRAWVSSSKPQLGHLIATCGAVELAVCIAALRQQRLPPNLNLDSPDPEVNVRLVRAAEPAKLDYVLSNSFGFGGQNSCLLLRRFVS